MTAPASNTPAIFALPEWLPHLGGLATFYAQLARCRSELGLPTIILTTQKGAEDPGWPGVEVVSILKEKNERFVQLCQTLPEHWEVAALALSTGDAMRNWLKDHAPSGAVVFAAEFMGYASCLRGPDLPPLVVTAHGSLGQIAARSHGGPPSPDLPLLRLLESDALLRAHAVSAYSPANATEWTKALGREVPCVDPPYFVSQNLDTPTANRPKESLTGVVLGRLQDWKGAQVLAKALDKLQSECPVRIDWYGSDTPTAPGGQSMASWLEKSYPGIWQKSFHWHGPLPREEAIARQAEADFALIPSHWDTLNFTVLEAMAAAKPVLVSTGAGASYLIENGVNGLVFPVDDSDALARTLQHLIKTPARLPALGQAARETLAERFTPTACTANYTALAHRATEAASSTLSTYTADSAGSILLPLLEAITHADTLPRHSGRDLLNALTRKLSQQLGIDHLS
ncbi:glycosyltransferase family 4 protein [Ruficoccus sp. ZRK36]|uniref:glycosyltransferase family 4 protein n=1 Tax=Ruficoccus sp. ZRK36 TaxID=2866311 RepID=UPI001C734AE1|nr:glycosyltransferase family 4 protein [Ruficoccus sp. ZRK36]QYY36313.1 glycosyltransferase family 4 protein [Ruficoccus sp. ZRK36]